jgi:prophage regulatory protein
VFHHKPESTMTDHKKLLRLPAVKEATGLARSTIYALIAKGEFPRPIKLTPKLSAWDAAEIDAWIEARIAGRAPAREAAHV